MVCGDANYCSVKNKTYADSTIRRMNRCKDFKLNPIDALGENDEGYRPYHKNQSNQLYQLELEYIKQKLKGK